MQKNLYMILLGCKPPQRLTEQHDIFFGICESLNQLIPAMNDFWPEAEGKIHIDAWRKVSVVNGYDIGVHPKDQSPLMPPNENRLFFLNLGGYKENDFEEYHYKLLVVAPDKTLAIRQAKETAFFKHSTSSHIDDKYGVDVDDVYEIEEVLPPSFKENYRIAINQSSQSAMDDEIHPGYIKLSKLV